MEKSVEYGLDYYISQMPGTGEQTRRAVLPWCWPISATVFLIW